VWRCSCALRAKGRKMVLVRQLPHPRGPAHSLATPVPHNVPVITRAGHHPSPHPATTATAAMPPTAGHRPPLLSAPSSLLIRSSMGWRGVRRRWQRGEQQRVLLVPGGHVVHLGQGVLPLPQTPAQGCIHRGTSPTCPGPQTGPETVDQRQTGSEMVGWLARMVHLYGGPRRKWPAWHARGWPSQTELLGAINAPV
jgi:hypothetical protein